MSDDDDFRAAMSDVAPLRQDGGKRATPKSQATGPSPAQLQRQRAALGLTDKPAVDPNPLSLSEVAQIHPREILAWKKDGVQHEVFGKLKAGKYAIEGELDLHRLTVKEAREKVFDFIKLARAKGWRTVLISHGRGELSATPARIKSYVAHWLCEVDSVIAFHSAQNHHGGTGSVYVLLKKTLAAKEATREQFGQKSDLE